MNIKQVTEWFFRASGFVFIGITAVVVLPVAIVAAVVYWTDILDDPDLLTMTGAVSFSFLGLVGWLLLLTALIDWLAQIV